MNKRIDKLKKILDEVEIYYEGVCISSGVATEKGKGFLFDSVSSSEHSISFWLHNGNRIYTVVAFAVALLTNLITDETSSGDTMLNISVGDIVEYRQFANKVIKCEYQGKYSGNDKTFIGKYVFKKDKNIYYLPESGLYKITPYNGNSKSLSSVGIGRKTSKRVDFLKNIVGLGDSEISSVPGSSIVMFMKDRDLDDILEKTYISIDKKNYWIRDLARVSYYTPTQEHRKAGNSSNNEPAIKVSYSIDRIMELVADNQGTNTLGFIAFDKAIYKNYGADFERLLKRKKLSFSWLITKYAYDEWINGYLDGDNKGLSILPYAHGFLDDSILICKEENRFNILNNIELNIAINKKVESLLVKDVIPVENYRITKDRIRYIIKNSNDIDYVVSFARWAYSMLKFFNNAIFAIDEYEQRLSLTGTSLLTRIEENAHKTDLFPSTIRDKAKEVVDYIKRTYTDLFSYNKKIETIRQYIWENGYNNVLFVVANNIFADLLGDYIVNNIKFKNFRYDVITESQIENVFVGRKYDLVVYTSLMNYESHNPYNDTLSSDTIVAVYDSQIGLFNRIMITCEDYEKKISSYVKDSTYKDTKSKYEIVGEDEYTAEKEFKEFFVNSFINNEIYQSHGEYGANVNEYDHFLEAYKYGQFTDGEQIIFTKKYIAYVIDAEKGAIEKKVDDLSPGDELLFTINDNKTKDLIDELLENVCAINTTINNSYDLTESWKKKLRSIRDDGRYTYRELVRRFKNCGKTTTEQTIRTWIDIESHIVGPKSEEDYLFIGKVIGNQSMIDNPNLYCNAAKDIRGTRMKLLRLVKDAVLYDTSKEINNNDDPVFNKEIVEKIKKITVIKCLEDIRDIEAFSIPVGRANIPVGF